MPADLYIPTSRSRMVNSMTHYLKTLPEYFEDVLSGKKSFEVRKDDRNPKFAPGDKLILQEYMKTSETGVYTGRVIHADVLLVLRGEYCRDGYCIMSIVPVFAINARFEAVTDIGRLRESIAQAISWLTPASDGSLAVEKARLYLIKAVGGAADV